ncbi:urea transport system ATP-binding protein [Chitinophaga costaii]|uniref:Urea transport system ATP-binding protein n=1 Tax=Chitinophaga costaii TaxID=1335309 RepID=A0A1C4DHW3_9BACT|nr:urea ABC transporter ATP-binding protein UrtD [Chitinophaga costaii]PUZ24638.1 urea ABC transporter ATP-binding protein UrtD [Chitinophaga costaii]SCC30856.1 urea transport system ATP-binding protein [Chitinophaga costaii]
MLLSVKDLAVSFGGVHALALSQFSLRDKELRVIIGPNGAGKSTFLDILCGKTKADKGQVFFNDTLITGKTEVQIARLGIGRKFQKPSVFPGLSVYDNLLLAARMKKDIFSSLFFKATRELNDRLHQVAEKVGLVPQLQKLAGSLSHGQQQWLEIAIVVLQDPKLMLVDEPAAGLSTEETEKTGALLLELSNDHSIIVIEHDMQFVQQIAKERVTVLVSGRLLMEDTFSVVRNDQRVIDCYLGRTNPQLEII